MRFLLDQDVYALTAAFLRTLGHDVLTVSALGLSKADDSVLLKRAQADGRILVTRDRDFGGLVFVAGAGPGILYLRVAPATLNAVHEELRTVLAEHSEVDLRGAFTVVEPGRHRFRPIGR